MHSLSQLYSGELEGAKHLKISCGLTEFPREIFSLADSLEILDLSGNRLTSLPADFGRLTQLKVAFFSDNLFTVLPGVLADCPNLGMIGFKANQIESIPDHALPAATRWLILTNNRILQIPKTIGQCPRLQKVAFAGNALTELPVEMADCMNLELLRLSANRFYQFPEWLPQLPKLSWLAFAGNPFSTPTNIKEEKRQFSWKDFQLREFLGEGASGHIHRAYWPNMEKEVAIKIFKGEITSDGFPADEMQTHIAAGEHPNLVALAGKIKDHPQQKQGLVMELIPGRFRNLGMPPSFASCTRDVFAEGTAFREHQILKIAQGIASAAAQLHQKSIMHGDLYAHNILIDEEANVLMGDFGAASFYETIGTVGKKIQQIESRAFGCLLDDLLTYLEVKDSNENGFTVTNLKTIRDACMSSNTIERPLFAELLGLLNKLKPTV